MNSNPRPKFGVVASIAEASPLKFKQSVAHAQPAHSFEICLDPLLHRFTECTPLLTECVIKTSLSKWIILTLRSKGQGGKEKLSLRDQWNFWNNLPSPIMTAIHTSGSNILVDWDLSLFFYVTEELRLPPPFPWSQIGSSLNDFSGTPGNLRKRLELLEATEGQAFIKFITTIRTAEDEDRLQALFEGRVDQRPLIAFGMGFRGQNSRRKCLSWGSAATYGCVPHHAAIAPGQTSISELLDDDDVKTAFRE